MWPQQLSFLCEFLVLEPFEVNVGGCHGASCRARCASSDDTPSQSPTIHRVGHLESSLTVLPFTRRTAFSAIPLASER